MVDQTTSPQRLPVLRTVSRAYRAPFDNVGTLVRVSWLWLVLMAPIVFLFGWLTWPWLVRALRGDQWWGTALLWADTAVRLPFLSSIAVAWHRLLLRNEHIRSNFYLRLDRV